MGAGRAVPRAPAGHDPAPDFDHPAQDLPAPCDYGIATADGLYALVAAVGGASLTQVAEPFMTPLRWASALVLLALAASASWQLLLAGLAVHLLVSAG
ncbi:hypothetical protein ACFWZ2_41535 [Streptomyces sp. NPDC059002]|uniref:hypothetical protein n=1 Tax=Streptomyces sp. NPDC059002 TaxID=3346690 RepID=UPI00368F7FB3